MTITPLDLVPGESVGPFQIGSLLFNVLNHVRSYRHAYPTAKLLWDDENPSTTPIHLILSRPPVHLSFEPLSQRLSRIQVTSTRDEPASAGAWVVYRGKLLRDDREDREDVVRTVRRVLGPTYGSSKLNLDSNPVSPTPISKDEEGEEEEEVLSYPGVALGVTERGSKLKRIIVFDSSSSATASVPIDQAWLHPSLPLSPAVAAGDLRIAEIYLDPNGSQSPTVTLYFHSSREGGTDPVDPIRLEIGQTSSEDVLSDLGTAVRSFWKQDERMSIHNAASQAHSSSSASSDPSLSLNPYFLSYPHLGLTLLLDPPSSNTPSLLTKIILHSNLPGQTNFGRTCRCTWTIKTIDDGEGNRAGGEAEVGGESKFVEIKERLRRRRRGGGGGNAQHDKSPPPPQSLPVPVPIQPSAPALATSTMNGEEKKKKKTGSNKSKTLKEVDLLGSSLESSSTSPITGRAPSPLQQETLPSQSQEEDEEEKPMILDRTAAAGDESDLNGGGNGTSGASDQTTEIHGFPGIAFEVTKTGDVETVWLF